MVNVFKEEKEGQGSWTTVTAGLEGVEALQLGRAPRMPSVAEHGEILPAGPHRRVALGSSVLWLLMRVPLTAACDVSFEGQGHGETFADPLAFR